MGADAALAPMRFYIPYRYAPWRWLSRRCWNKYHIPPNPKYFYQRLTRGWCDADVWNFDGYLARVIAGGCRRLRDTTYGYPMEVYNRKGKLVGEGDEDAAWRTMLARIIDGMELFEAEVNEDIPREHWESHKKRKLDALLLLAYNFEGLWD
jgi:hypothetical protein